MNNHLPNLSTTLNDYLIVSINAHYKDISPENFSIFYNKKNQKALIRPLFKPVAELPTDLWEKIKGLAGIDLDNLILKKDRFLHIDRTNFYELNTGVSYNGFWNSVYNRLIPTKESEHLNSLLGYK